MYIKKIYIRITYCAARQTEKTRKEGKRIEERRMDEQTDEYIMKEEEIEGKKATRGKGRKEGCKVR